MSEQSLELYIILARILKRCELSANALPADLNKWHEFVGRINNCFLDVEQERYLLERSMEISSREMQELNTSLEKTRSSMVDIARRAGMSEVATTILHNIGNILNSVNVSVSQIDELIHHCRIDHLVKISEMINENLSNRDFLLSDQKGKLIPEYLTEFSINLKNNLTEMNAEIVSLNRNLEHITKIIVMQKDLSGIAGVLEKIFLPEVLDLALKMTSGIEKYDIELVKKYEYSDSISTDKAKLLQILINLIRNAIEAMVRGKKDRKHILTLSIIKSDDLNIKISVEDNGMGISKINLAKIFSMGFTTKESGHGFGLHSSALAAKELGGSLQVESLGSQQGATFILTLPIHPEDITI